MKEQQLIRLLRQDPGRGLDALSAQYGGLILSWCAGCCPPGRRMPKRLQPTCWSRHGKVPTGYGKIRCGDF